MINEWISAEFNRLAEIIEEYDSYLELQWIPPEKRENQLDRDQCWRVIDTRTNSIVLFAKEYDPPTDILARIWGMDQKNGNPVRNMDAKNAAIAAMQLKEKIDQQESQLDLSIFILKNEKNYWIHEGRKRDADFNDLGSPKKHIT